MKCDICPKEAVWIDKSLLGNFAYCETHEPMMPEAEVKKGKRFERLFTEELIRKWHQRFIVEEGRSMVWLSKKENNGIADCSSNTISIYFRKYGLETNRKKRSQAMPVEPVARKKPEIGELDIPTALNGQLEQIWRKMKDLDEVGELERLKVCARTHFVSHEEREMAGIMKEELESRQPLVELIPSRIPEVAAKGGKIRAVIERNPRWYRQYCSLYPKRRRQPRRRKKPDTKIRRELTLNSLAALAKGRCETTYSQRLLPVVREEIERRNIDHPDDQIFDFELVNIHKEPVPIYL